MSLAADSGLAGRGGDAVPLSVIGGSFGGKDGTSVSPDRSSRWVGWSLGFSTPACVSLVEMRELACSLESGENPLEACV